MKNYVFWIGVKSNNQLLKQKHGNFAYLDISEKSWRRWCEKWNVEFVPYTLDNCSQPNQDTHRVTWTRWFDIANIIPYDKKGFRWVIDGSTLININTPPPWQRYNLDQNTVYGFRSLENVQWIYDGVTGYSDLFPDVNFDLTKYISCGNQIFTQNHYDFLSKLQQFYFDNQDVILNKQHTTVKKGTDQCPYNYLLQQQKVVVDTHTISTSYMVTHLRRFDWFLNSQWQLPYNTLPHCVKYGDVLVFSGYVDRANRQQEMQIMYDNFYK